MKHLTMKEETQLGKIQVLPFNRQYEQTDTKAQIGEKQELQSH